MIIAHNLSAMNGNRMFNINNKKRASMTEKLSSGYKINRSADDAAGLAISEKMRRQIRGLEQGRENIQDGISLVQVAEGALGEITECLQRVNELSIKAYNGTNQKEDREYIQSEINQIITEIKRISDTTTFNEMDILKGNPTKTVLIDEHIYEGYIYDTYETQIPDWLKVTPTLDKSNSVGLSGYTQITDENAVYQVTPGQYVYYGPQDVELAGKGYGYGREWTTDLSDNACAIIDYNDLANTTDATDLYNKLFQLIGTSIGVPCGTCTEYYGISYTGSEMGLEVEEGTTYYPGNVKASESYLNLSEWKPFPEDNPGSMSIFDSVKDMIKTHAEDDSLSQTQKEDAVKDLAKIIATKLCDESYNQIAKTMNAKDHFDRVIKTNDNRIVIYDFRDTDTLVNADIVDSKVQTSSYVKAKIPFEVKRGEYAEVVTPLYIQCSAKSDDELPFDLPYIDNIAMGIEGYNVANYRVTKVYSEEYKEKLADWQKNGCHYEDRTEVIPGSPATTKKVMLPYLDYNEDGEFVTNWTEQQVAVPATPDRTVTRRVLVEDTPMPQPGPNDIYTEYTYEPDDVKLIKDALAYVVECRSNLGATQNRMEHAYNSNGVNLENTTAAESRIRDTDMAMEMVAFSNSNIIAQAGQAMLAQANQMNQNILALLG